MSYNKTISYLPIHSHYFKKWGSDNFIEHKTPLVFSTYMLPGFDDLLRVAKHDNEQLYVVCPQYANANDEIIDMQYVITGKATTNEGKTSEDIIYNGTIREIAEETGLEVSKSNIGKTIAYRMAGKKNGKHVTVHSFYCRIFSHTQLNKITTPSIGIDDPTKKIQVLIVGKKENLIDIMSNNLIPIPSNDTIKSNSSNGSYICGIRLVALKDVLNVFLDYKKTLLIPTHLN